MFVAVAVLTTVTALGFLALGAMDQRTLRRWFAARQGRDPEAGEPSAAGYAAGRVAWLALAALFAFGAYQSWASVAYFGLGQDEAREIVDDAVSDLEAEPRLPTSTDGFETYVRDAVRDAAQDTGATTRVALDGEGVGTDAARKAGTATAEGGVERYDVALDDGEYRYCLVVTSTRSEEGGMTAPGAFPGQEATHFPAYDFAVDARNGTC